MELSRRTWNAAVKLAVIISIAAASFVVAVQPGGGVPQAAIVLPVIVIAFSASWVQTGRVRRQLVVPTQHRHR
ncbi:MAG TPA: hypothetical protein VK860_01045 [Ilumatobacteraceae bacterium]|nr:hypothetical protein [Ilumatobacteraceae bacterium]